VVYTRRDGSGDAPSYSGSRAARHAAPMAGCLPTTMMGIGAMVNVACDQGRLGGGRGIERRTRARRMSDGRETSDVNMNLGISSRLI
jgi:hypothetical protein